MSRVIETASLTKVGPELKRSVKEEMGTLFEILLEKWENYYLRYVRKYENDSDVLYVTFSELKNDDSGVLLNQILDFLAVPSDERWEATGEQNLGEI